MGKCIMQSSNYYCCTVNNRTCTPFKDDDIILHNGAYYGQDKHGLFYSFGQVIPSDNTGNNSKAAAASVIMYRKINGRWIKRREYHSFIKRDINKINGAYWRKCNDKTAIAADYIIQYEYARKYFEMQYVTNTMTRNFNKTGASAVMFG